MSRCRQAVTIIVVAFALLWSIPGLAGDLKQNHGIDEQPRVSNTLGRDTSSLQSKKSICRTVIDDFKHQEIVPLKQGLGYEVAFFGEWSGYWWNPEEEVGGIFNIHFESASMYHIRSAERGYDKGYRLTLRSYETMRQRGTVDGCGNPPTKRFPSGDLSFILSWFEEVNGGWILNYAEEHHNFKMHRVIRSGGKVDFYLISHTRFGTDLIEGGWFVEVIVKANDATAAAIEEVYRRSKKKRGDNGSWNEGLLRSPTVGEAGLLAIPTGTRRPDQAQCRARTD